MKFFFIVLSLSIVSYLIGQGIVDFISVSWNSESCCFSIKQGTLNKKVYSVLGGEKNKDILMMSDSIFIPERRQKEFVFFLE